MIQVNVRWLLASLAAMALGGVVGAADPAAKPPVQTAVKSADKAADKAAEKARQQAAAAERKAAEEKAASEDKARRQAASDAAVAFETADLQRREAERALKSKSASCAAAARKFSGEQEAFAAALAARVKSGKSPADIEAFKKSGNERLAKSRDSADKAKQELKAAEKALAEKTAEADALLTKSQELEAVAYGGLAPLPAGQWDYAKARHLAVRAGFGATPEEIDALVKMGLHRAVAHLVDYQKQPAYAVAYSGTPPERPHPDEGLRTPEERQRLSQKRMGIDSREIQQLRSWWMQRLVASNRPMEEKLTLFWSNHFATEHRTVRDSYAMYLQNQLERAHANGNFGSMLHGMINDPAMLRYLDNNRNVKGRANENLAREIMELFSMGEGLGYTEKDIMEAARALTGYTYDRYAVQFRYVHSSHDDEPKTIFGRKGNYTGDDLVDLILQQPVASRFIAGKLFKFFAYEKPAGEIVDRLATLLKRRQFELAPMLKNLLSSREFYSELSMGTQIKSPVQLLVGALRDLGIKDVDYAQLTSAVRSMEQDLFDPPNVKGWEEGRAWVNSNRLFVRYNATADMIERIRIGEDQYGLDLAAALGGMKAESPALVVDQLIARLYVRPLPAAKRQQLIDFLGSLPPAAQWADRKKEINAKLRSLLVLMLTLPEYQLG